MKALVFVLVALALLVSTMPARAFGEPPAGLVGILTITARNTETVTLHAEQTGGAYVRLTLQHTCYDNTTRPIQQVKFTGSTDATFDIGPRQVRGHLLYPSFCYAN